MTARAFAVLVLLTCSATQSFASLRYTARKTGEARSRDFTVMASSRGVRADLPPHADDAVLYTSVLWRGEEKAIALNATNETWYELEPEPLALGSRFLSPLMHGKAKNVRWAVTGDELTPEGNRRYSARLTYDVHGSAGGTRVKVRCTADFTVETTSRYPRTFWLGRVLGRTGLAEVDAQLAVADRAMAGFPTRLRLTATRAYAGGPAMRDSVTIETIGVREQAIEPADLERPAGYRHQVPVLGVPGRQEEVRQPSEGASQPRR